MTDFITTTDALLTGTLSRKAQGFLLALPLGTTARKGMHDALTRAYGMLPHPDVFILESEGGGPAKVDDVRKALVFAHTHPVGKALKTLWVPQADAMTPQAANAFLKTLEEPSSSARVVLGASRPERLLATTRSRCITLSVRGDDAFGREELGLQAPEASAKAIEQALHATNGAVDAATKLLIAKGGLDWALATETALRKGQLMPVPTGGVAGLDAPTAGLVVQVVLTRMLPTNVDAIGRKLDAAVPFMGNLDRPGLDMPTRIRALARAVHTA